MPPDAAAIDPAPSDPAAIAPAVRAALARYWGYETLRPLQAQAIQAGLARRDSLVVLPTGGGKSLCYQIPAVIAGRTDVVVSPLISLMKDQVDGLRASGFPAAALHSGMSASERNETQRGLLAGRCRLLFVAPERLRNGWLLGLLERVGVRAFAVDEAHCISHWGHDFRPEYRQLAELRERFPDASLHAYTATATQRVRDDIARQLRLRDPVVLIGCFDRPNLVYRILPKQDVYGQAATVLQRHPGQAAIVYCLSRADTELMAEYLRSVRVRAAHYHAGLDADTRRRTQEDFAAEKIDVVVATVAFGMGIDRSDVRCVIHAAIPKSVEHYQQETGRAGRDGLEAECVLFYSYADVARWEGLIEKSAAEAEAPPEVAAAARQLLGEMQRLCGGMDCRHGRISAYFGQPYERPNCAACDVCLGEIEGVADATVTAQKILSCVARVQERFGVGHVVDVLAGAGTARVRELGHDRLSTFGLLKDMGKKVIRDLIYQLVDGGVLARGGGEYPILMLNAASWQVMRGQRPVRLRQAPTRVQAAPVEEDAWAGVDQTLFERLRALRRDLARELNVPPFIILHDTVLRDLARRRPTSLAGLRAVSGIGAQKLLRFGQRLVEFVREYCRTERVAGDVALAPFTPKPPPRPKKVSPAKRQAFEMYAAGAAVEQVAAKTERAASTAWQYLEQFVADRRPDDVSRWVDGATYARVAAALRAAEGAALRPVFEQLGAQVPYEIIRVVARHLEATDLNAPHPS
jgi:ATP-dependent DNA helicase RecQ